MSLRVLSILLILVALFIAMPLGAVGGASNSSGINIYVGNLPYSYSSSDLEQLFSQAGTVSKAYVVMDRDTGRSRGFGFVEMPNREEGLAAIQEFNGAEVGGRRLNVNEARPRNPQARR